LQTHQSHKYSHGGLLSCRAYSISQHSDNGGSASAHRCAGQPPSHRDANGAWLQWFNVYLGSDEATDSKTRVRCLGPHKNFWKLTRFQKKVPIAQNLTAQSIIGKVILIISLICTQLGMS
jgi:hypothetical protein